MAGVPLLLAVVIVIGSKYTNRVCRRRLGLSERGLDAPALEMTMLPDGSSRQEI